jgi:hypothetical protein
MNTFHTRQRLIQNAYHAESRTDRENTLRLLTREGSMNSAVIASVPHLGHSRFYRLHLGGSVEMEIISPIVKT